MFDASAYVDHYASVRSRLGMVNTSSVVRGLVRVKPRDIIATVAPKVAVLGSVPDEMREKARIIMGDETRANIIRTVCAETGIGLGLILSKSRRRDIVFARHSIWVRCFMAGQVPNRIAKLFGVDHSALANAIDKFKAEVA